MNKINLNRRYINDLILLAVILLLGGILFLLRNITADNGAYIGIQYIDTYGNDNVTKLPLNSDIYVLLQFEITDGNAICTYYAECQELPVNPDGEYNIIQIKDQSVSVVAASCPDLVCVHTQNGKKDGDTIVCLPHKMIITVYSSDDKQEEIDAVTW